MQTIRFFIITVLILLYSSSSFSQRLTIDNDLLDMKQWNRNMMYLQMSLYTYWNDNQAWPDKKEDLNDYLIKNKKDKISTSYKMLEFKVNRDTLKSMYTMIYPAIDTSKIIYTDGDFTLHYKEKTEPFFESKIHIMERKEKDNLE